MTETQTLETETATDAVVRTGATRAAVPESLRRRRRNRSAAPLAILAVSAVALGGAILPGAMSEPAAASIPSVAQLADEQAQAYQASLSQVAGQPAASDGDEQPQAPVAPSVARDGASVEVETPTPTPTPTETAAAAPSSADSGSSSSSSDYSASMGYVAPAGEAQSIAHDMVLARGWGEGEFSCLASLYQRESEWNPLASNPYSEAYGIPQALPGSKMAAAGADWQYNAATQLDWGINYYIAPRYGTACAAWAHSERYGWY